MIRWMVHHSTTVLIGVVLVFFGGLYSYVSLPREAAPDIEIPVILVTTPYPGVSPEDVESLVTVPLERELASLRDVKEMTSTSAEGVSIVAIEFEPDVVMEDALQRVRDRVGTAEAEMPADAETPLVREIQFSDFPILVVTIAGEVDEDVLKRLAEDLEDEIARVPGVLEAKVTGGLEHEIRVEVDPLRLSHYGLTLRDVIGAIGDENVNIPGGTVPTEHGSVLVRVPGEFTDPRQVEDVAIKRIGDRPVFVRDVARVIDGYEDRTTYARMNGETAVSLSVTKRPGSNIVEVADLTKALVADASESWPEGVDYRVLSDQSIHIRDMVAELQNNIITALILVVGVIVVAMGFRTSAFVAMSIPLSLLASFLVLQALGFTLNMIVLFSLILALGMLVDNAIVIVENVYRHAENGKDVVRASIDAAEEVEVAVASSTATTVAAFLPLVFWTGIMGEFMGYLPKTLIITLTASLVAGVYIIPVAASRFMGQPKRREGVDPDDDHKAPLTLGPLMRAYRAVLEFSIRHRYVSLVLMGGLFVFTTAVFAVFNHGTEFFPATDPDRVIVRIVAPDGTDVETTDKIVRKVEGLLAAEENVDVYVSEVGVSASGDALSGSNAISSEAKISVDFRPDRNSAEPGEKARVEPTPVTLSRLRAAVAEIPGARIQVEGEDMGPPVGSPIEVKISGEDFHEVGAFAQKFRRKIAEIPGTTELRDDYKIGRPEMRLEIDRAAAKRVGVSTAEIGDTVRTAVAGAKAESLREGDDDHDIVVRLAPEHRDDPSMVLDLRVPGRVDTSPDTFAVPLSAVARYELAGGTGAIQHVDQDLVVTISGDILDGYNENDVRAAIQELIETTDAGDLVISTGGADTEQQESAAFLGRAFLIALALVALVLVTQFDSVAMPMIVMISVLLSLIGVMWGLLLTGTAFGVIMTGLGVISLAGVVVNNAIVLLDFVQQLRAKGLDAHDALIRAGILRFRPVMLTAITTVLGLVPMAIGVSFDFLRFKVLIGGSSAQFWGPMAIAVIFGLVFATVLTLVMVPTMYSIYDDLGHRAARVRAWLRPAVPQAAKVLPLALVALGLAGRADAVTLAEAVRAAEGHNVDLAMVREQTFQTELLRDRAWGLLQPRVRGNLGYNLSEIEVIFDPADMAGDFGDVLDTEPVVIQRKTFWTASATIDQPLFSARSLPLMQGAYSATDSARLDETRARQTIVAGVARAYYGVAVARAGLEVSEKSLATRKEQLTLAKRQEEAGTQTHRAVVQAELAVSQAERAVAQSREDIVAAETAFARVTGLPRDVAVELPDPPAAPASLEEALEEALASRPDYLASLERIRYARLDKTATGLGWVPRIDGQFTYQYNQNTSFADRPAYWTAGIFASWDLWDGGQRLADLRQKSSDLRMAELRAEDGRARVEEDVRTAWERYQRAESALLAVQAEVALAEESLELAERAFAAGSLTWLELQDAEVQLQAAEVGRIAERASRDLAVIDLLVAIGSPPL